MIHYHGLPDNTRIGSCKSAGRTTCVCQLPESAAIGNSY